MPGVWWIRSIVAVQASDLARHRRRALPVPPARLARSIVDAGQAYRIGQSRLMENSAPRRSIAM
jgi:hypothetical protein